MKTSFFTAMIFIISAWCYAQTTSAPVRAPAYFGGIDTLSKFSKKPSEGLKPSEGSGSKIPMQKPGGNKILDLITDPRVVYSSYFGGNGYDCSNGITVDSKDNIYLVGYSGSTDLPTTTNCFQKDKKAGHDAFIAKFTPDGQPIWITYYGGAGTDVAQACVLDANDNLYVVGKTDSPDFPVTTGTYKGSADAFIIKFSPDGERLWAELYGSSGFDAAEGVALMSNGDIVVAGYTNGMDLPVTGNAIYKTAQGNADIFVSRFNSDGVLVWGTYYGGYQNEITTGVAADKWDNIAVTGYHQTATKLPKISIFPTTSDAFQKDTTGMEDCFILKLSSDCKLLYASLYGGNKDDRFNGTTFDYDGNLFLAGRTESDNFPTTSNGFDNTFKQFEMTILKLDKFNQRQFSSFYADSSEAMSIYCDSQNNIYLTGWTVWPYYQIIGNAIQGISNPSSFGGTKIILFEMDQQGKPEFSLYYGAMLSFGYDIFSKNKTIFVTGENSSTRFPFTEKAFQKVKGSMDPGVYDSYITIIDLNKTEIINTTDIMNILVYPNPFKDQIQISMNGNNRVINLFILNFLGEVLYSLNNINEGKVILNLQKLPKGFYNLMVQSGTILLKYKLIKQ